MTATIDGHRTRASRVTPATRSNAAPTEEQNSGAGSRLEALVDRFETRGFDWIVEDGAVLTAAYDAGIKHAVHEALLELAAGCYGYCIVCGEHIPVSRLDEVPYARRCAGCQQQEEDSWNDVEHLFASFIRQWVGEPQGPTPAVPRRSEP